MTWTQQDEDDLERRLLTLGGLERDIKEKLDALKRRGREFGQAGRFVEADAVFNEYYRLKQELRPLMDDIEQVERLLYGMRRRRQS